MQWSLLNSDGCLKYEFAMHRYYFAWYIRHALPLSLKHFLARAQQTGAFNNVETAYRNVAPGFA